jgi:hypothetical protein
MGLNLPRSGLVQQQDAAGGCIINCFYAIPPPAADLGVGRTSASAVDIKNAKYYHCNKWSNLMIDSGFAMRIIR